MGLMCLGPMFLKVGGEGVKLDNIQVESRDLSESEIRQRISADGIYQIFREIAKDCHSASGLERSLGDGGSTLLTSNIFLHKKKVEMRRVSSREIPNEEIDVEYSAHLLNRM